MGNTGFKCPKCGQTECFTAFEVDIMGPVDITEEGYEPRYGHGLEYQIPDDVKMVCVECGYDGLAEEFNDSVGDFHAFWG